MMGTCGSEDEGSAALFDVEQAERKKIEQALRESERKYQKLIKYAPAAIYEIDFRKNRFTSVNDAMCLMSGYSREELLAMDPLDIMSEQSRAVFKKRLEQWLNGEEPVRSVDYTVIAKDGREAFVALNVTFTSDENGAPLGATAVAQDITERKQAEEALRRIAEELKKKEEETLELIDGFTEGSWIVDRLEGTIKCSEKWAKRIGLDEVPEKERLAYTHALVHPDDTADGNSIEHCMEAGMPRFDLEYRVKTVDSGYIWTQNRGKIAYDGQGRAVKVYAATIDITERKKAEEALYERTNELEEANRQKEDILESISDCFYVLDKNLRFTYVNKPAEEIWGLSRADLIGRKIEDIFPGIIDISLSKFHQVLLEKSRQHYEVYSKVIGRWGDMGVYPMRDGISVYFRDTTERKKAVEALRESEEKYRLLFENMTEMFQILEPIFDDEGNTVDFRYIEINKATERLTGKKNEEIEGKTARELWETVEDYWLEMLGKVLKTGEAVHMENYSRELDTYYDLYAWKASEHRVAIVFSNVTDKKSAEEALRQSEEKYRILFDSIDEGFCIVEVLFDDNNKPLDYRFLEVNKSFEKQTGLVDAKGCLMRDMAPDHEQHWFDIYGRIALTGESARFQNPAEALGRFYDVYAFRVGKPEQRRVAILFNDISNRKQSEEALHESEEKYRTLFNNSQYGFVVIEPLLNTDGRVNDLRYLEINPAFERQTGLKAKDFLNKSLCEALPKIEPEWLEVFDQVVKNGKTVRYENYNNDTNRWYEVAVFPYSNGLLGEQFIDITERKRAEEALRESEDRLLAFMTASSDVMYRMNPEWSEMTALYGKGSLADTEGTDAGWMDKYIYTDDQPHVTEVIKSCIREKSILELEYRVQRADGSIGWTNLRAIPILDEKGEIREWFGAASDITEKKTTEFEKERLIALMDHNPSLVFLKDEGGRYVYLNKAYETNFIPSGSWYGKTDFDFWPKESAELFRTNDAYVLYSGQTRQFIEDSTDMEGKRYCWLNYKFPFTDSNNRKYVGGIGIDFTRLILAEEALQASEKKAITLVKELEKADQNKNEFLSALSHELRNPLAAISAGLQLLDITKDEEQAKTAKEIMNRQMDQLCRLVDELLDLTRITNNKITLKKECVDINRLIQLSANDHRPLFDKKRLKFNVTPCSEKLLAEADPVRVKQITSNLLHNAFKFSNEGGEVTLSAYEQDGYAVICVKDSGIGISYDDLPKLFKPFAQIDNNIERANGGLGLGLSIVKGIAQLHGGDAEAASEGEGRGASFLIKLPLDKNVNGQPTRDAAPAVSTEKLKVLFIEDNKDYSEMFCAMMGILGCEVAAAPDGAQGLKKAKEYLPDVVICDIGLPGMNGYEVAKALRNDEATKRMFMVALTGYARPQDIEAALAAGFDRHMAKPVSMEALKQILGAARQ